MLKGLRSNFLNFSRQFSGATFPKCTSVRTICYSSASRSGVSIWNMAFRIPTKSNSLTMLMPVRRSAIANVSAIPKTARNSDKLVGGWFLGVAGMCFGAVVLGIFEGNGEVASPLMRRSFPNHCLF